MHAHACVKQAACIVHIRKSNRYPFRFYFWSGRKQRKEAARARACEALQQACFLDKAHQRLSPCPRLEASSPHALICSTLSTRKAEVFRAPPPPSGGQQIHPKKTRKYIQTAGTYNFTRSESLEVIQFFSYTRSKAKTRSQKKQFNSFPSASPDIKIALLFVPHKVDLIQTDKQFTTSA
jgi:hypothetical protein